MLKIAVCLMVAGAILEWFPIFNWAATTEEPSQPFVLAILSPAWAVLLMLLNAWLLCVPSMWLWMAWQNWRGRGWARVLSTVFCGLGCLTRTALIDPPPAGLLYGLWPNPIDRIPLFGPPAIGLIAVTLIWLPPSSRYYAAVKQHRRQYGNGPWTTVHR